MKYGELLSCLTLGTACVAACGRDPTEEEFTAARERLVRTSIERRGIEDARVLAAMRKVRRHRFVLSDSRGGSYRDDPLPIGWGQTISQPYVVAFMSAAVAPGPEDRCLEIGTGSGYQAAILAELCAKVYTIEVVPELKAFAEQNLRSEGYGPDRVELQTGDGYPGWPEAAPFQVMVVTAAPRKVPEPLLAQVAPGGRLIVPVGPAGGTQQLELWTRRGPGHSPADFLVQSLLPVAFVPFVGH
jgi:protein-L-isoaspartate(D-aspartate) O-methyltransferase